MGQAQPSLQVARWAGAHSGRGGGSHPFTPRTVCRGDLPLNEPDRNRAWSERSALGSSEPFRGFCFSEE